MGGLFGTPKMPPPTPPPSAEEIAKQIQEDVKSKNLSLERAEQSAMSLERAAAYRRQAGFGSSQVSAGSGVGMRLS